jgi:hypothetical protein
MKTFLTGILALVAVGGVALAQETTAPRTATAPLKNPQSAAPSSQTERGTLRIAPGSVVPVELTRTIDAKKAKTGDEIKARVNQDLKGDSSEVIVPRNTKVMGHITEVEARSKDQKTSQVGIAFDHAVMKSGDDVPLPMTVQAIIAPPNSSPDNGYAGSETTVQAVSPSSAGGMGGNSNGRPAMGSGAPPQSLSPTTTGGDASTGAQTGMNPRQPITANTQGVVGLSNLKLAGSTTQGSIISSEKGNVKLESGTLMLLKVNP